MTIYKSKVFKPIFNYKNNQIKDIIILSNNSLLLYCSEQDYCSILNISGFSESIKKIKINYKYEIEDIDSISFVKLHNNYILFCYIYRNEDNLRTRDEPNKYYYSYYFYYYDRKISDLILDYEDTQFFQFIGLFLPYEESFFYYGNDTFYCYSALPQDYSFIYFYRKKSKKIETVYEKNDRFSSNFKLINCIIFQKKYLIAQFLYNLEKYEITKEKIQLVSTYSNEIKIYDILENRDNLIFVYKGENNNKKENDESKDYTEDLYFSEVNNQNKIIKTQKIGIQDYFKILCYEKTIYLSSDNNMTIYY